MEEVFVGLIIIATIVTVGISIYFIINNLISNKNKEKFPLTEKKQGQKGIGIHTLFTKRDELLSDLNYATEPDIDKIQEVKFNPYSIFPLVIFIIGYFIMIQYFKNTLLDVDNLRYLFSASAQTIGAILGISISMILIFTQLYMKTYRKQVIRSIFLDKQIKYLIGINVSTIVLCLLNLVSLSDPVAESRYLLYVLTLFLVILCLVLLFYVLARFFILMDPKRILRDLEKRLRKSIQKRDVNDVESIVHSLAQIIDTSIMDKDRDILKEGIDVIHDFIKYYIRNWEDIFKKIELRVGREEGMYNFSDWLLDEVLSHYTTFFRELVDSHQYNSASYLVRALSSCGVESLNYPDERAKSMISKTYKNILNYSLKLDQDSSEKISRGFSNFIKYTLLLERIECYMTLSELFEEEFIENILKKKPQRISILTDPLYNSINGIEKHFKGGKKETLPMVIRLFSTVISVSQYLSKYKEFDYLIAEQNKKLQSYLADLCVLIGIFCFHNGWKDLALKCKKEYFKVIDEKKVFEKIEKNLRDSDDDIRNLTINHRIHYIFWEHKSDSEPFFFDRKRFLKSYKGYRKLSPTLTP